MQVVITVPLPAGHPKLAQGVREVQRRIDIPEGAVPRTGEQITMAREFLEWGQRHPKEIIFTVVSVNWKIDNLNPIQVEIKTRLSDLALRKQRKKTRAWWQKLDWEAELKERYKEELDEYHPEGYPKDSTVLEDQVRDLLNRGKQEIAAGEQYLEDRMMPNWWPKSLKEQLK